MIQCKEIDEYIQYARAHPKWINKERRLLIKNIVLPTLIRDDVVFDEKTYRDCIAYCEKHYYPLFPYQKFVYAFVFMYVNNMPLFPKIIVVMGRGNGKDGFMAPLCNFLQTPLYGVKNYHIDIVANSEEQAKETFKVVYNAVDTPAMKKKFSVTKELITNIKTKSELKYNTSNAKTKDGKRPGLVLFNEIHAYEDYSQINVHESGRGKVEHPRVIIITTDGYVREGVYDEYIEVCKEILETGENPLGYFPFICRLDDKKEVDNEEAWHKANPSMEYLPILAHQIKMDYLEAKKFPSKWAEFVTKRMNMDERDEGTTVTKYTNVLKACYADPDKKIVRQAPDISGKSVIVAIDYADVRDFASIGILYLDGDEVVWRQHTWICSQSPNFNSIKFPMITNMGTEGFTDYTIVDDPVIPISAMIEYIMKKTTELGVAVTKFVMDTYRYGLFKEEFEKYGIYPETRKNPDERLRLIRKPGSVCGIIAPEIETAFDLGLINYGNSAIMRWYTNNTAIQTDKFGNKQFVKIEPKLRKNDGFMAFVIAFYCRELVKEKVLYV